MTVSYTNTKSLGNFFICVVIFKKKEENMKLLPSLFCVSFASAFTTQQVSTVRDATILFASRNKQKIESRSKWAESKGVGSSASEVTNLEAILFDCDGVLADTER